MSNRVCFQCNRIWLLLTEIEWRESIWFLFFYAPIIHAGNKIWMCGFLYSYYAIIWLSDKGTQIKFQKDGGEFYEGIFCYGWLHGVGKWHI